MPKGELKHSSISSPLFVEQKVHVDKDFNWTSGDPTQTFELTTKLGEGSFGAVYKAAYKQTGFVMAIKVIQVGKNAQAITKEVDLLKKVNHKNAVRYYGSCVSGDSVWILMDYCGSGSIHDILEVTVIPEKPLQWIVFSVLEGLTYLHGQSIIHRDIKAANILLTDDCEIKLADFGVSEQISQTIMAHNTTVGTPYFMSPEVVQGANYNTLADIWSFGITVIEMCEGCPPMARDYPNPMRAMFKIPFVPAPKLFEPEKFSKKLADFLSLCLVKEAQKRSSASDLLTHNWLNGAIKHRKNLLELLVEVRKEREVLRAQEAKLASQKTVKPQVALLKQAVSGQTLDFIDEQPSGTFVQHDTVKPSGTVVQHDSGTFISKDDGSTGTVIFTGKQSDEKVLSNEELDAPKKTLFSRFRKTTADKKRKIEEIASSAEPSPMIQRSQQIASNVKAMDVIQEDKVQSEENVPKARNFQYLQVGILVVFAFVVIYYRYKVASLENRINLLQQMGGQNRAPKTSFCSMFC